MMIASILDACQEVLELNGEPQSSYWLASQMVGMRMWRASEHDARAALKKNTNELGEESRFIEIARDQWALRSWESDE